MKKFVLFLFTIAMLAMVQGAKAYNYAVSPFVTGVTGPQGIAVDNNGNTYVVNDTGSSNSILKIDGNGVVSTLATLQINSYADYLAFDPVSNALYVYEVNNDTINKVTLTGVVTQFAGQANPHTFTISDGTLSTALLTDVAGMCADGKGNLFVSDGNCIQQISIAGNFVKTIAGNSVSAGSTNGIGTAALFFLPGSLAADAFGNIYVSDTNNYVVRKIAPTVSNGSIVWIVTTLAGTPRVHGWTDATGAAAQFSSLSGIVVDSTCNVYVADDNFNGIIRRITSSGVVTTLMTYVNGVFTNFYTPYSMAIDAAGTLYVIDDTVGDTHYNNYIIYKASSSDPTNGRLVNVSCRNLAGSGNNTLIGGYATNGSVPLLQRGVGPGLASTFQLTGTLSDPKLTLYDSNNAVVMSNTGWSTGLSGSQITALQSVMLTVGAFPLTVGSTDSVLNTNVNGPHTLQVTSVSGSTGTALVEVYDTTVGAGALSSYSIPHLTNISSRGEMTSNSNPLIIGFVIAGAPKKVLIRAVGPGLTSTFQLTGTLQDPVLTLYDSHSQPITTNSGWQNDVILSGSSGVFAATGAFPLVPNSGDSVLFVTLPAGVYSVAVTSVMGSSGVALAELYEVQ